MTLRVTVTSLLVSFLALSAVGAAAQSQPTTVAPTIVRLEGELRTAQGEVRTGSVVMQVSLYATQDDQAPIWSEEQTVALDAAGRYVVLAGATQAEGLPRELLASNQAQWIGLAVAGEPELPRIRILSVPYAASAGNADTLGGAPATDFVMSGNLTERVRDVLNGGIATGVASAGLDSPFASTPGFLARFTDTINGTGNGSIYDNGNISVGTTTPASLFHLTSAATGGQNLFTVENTHEDGYGPVFVASKNSASPANGDFLGYFTFWGKNSSAVRKDFGQMFVKSDNVLAGSEASSFHWVNMVAGTETEVLTVLNANLGVGTSTPGVRLSISGNSASSNPLIGITDTNTGGHTFYLGPLSSPAGFEVYDATASASRLFISGTGNVGLGTNSPTAKLTVSGDVVVSGNIGAKYQDVAEWVETGEVLEVGTVVIVDPHAVDRVKPSSVAYDTGVAGAVSRQPGLILGERGDTKSLVAQSGRVIIKVDAKYGAIKPGDLLVTSPTPGHAMLSKPMKIGRQSMHRPGTLVGKALQGLASGKGEILVLLTLQ